MAIFDLRQQRQRAQWSAHSLAARSLALDASTGLCFSASSDGDMKLCDLAPSTSCPSMPSLQGWLQRCVIALRRPPMCGHSPV